MYRRELLKAAAGATVGLMSYGYLNEASAQVEDSLRNLADRKGFRFGSAIDYQNLQDEWLKDLYRTHCNSLTARNSMKWVGTERSPGKFTFGQADAIVAFAEAEGMKSYGHTLVWKNVPSWVSKIKDAAEARKVMLRHVRAVVGHFKGRVDAWDVVNEPMEYDTAEMRSWTIQNLLGDDYVTESFLAAHEADPDAVLVLNEAHLEKVGSNFEQRRILLLKLIEAQLAKGAPIHAVGLQGHFRPGIDKLDEAAVARFCGELKDMGLSVFITELDASCRFTYADKKFNEADYGKIFESFVTTVAESGNLKGVTVWGLAERYGELEPKPVGACRKYINLYDDNNEPRSTVEGLTAALNSL
ncbi:endo-1,4-beta-xylanase [Rhizobium sp. ZK1]|uniref:endo-1,4-beta-xylanase n=1 Tax=Rhizobium sp. ZK1 TaxID=3389872 RepID=UPI0039F6CAAB